MATKKKKRPTIEPPKELRPPTVRELDEILPDPEILADIAEQAMPKISVERYWASVLVLRSKNYSWREVSEWLSEQGVDLHYKRLERYAKSLEQDGNDET